MALPSSVRSVIILPGDVRPSLIRPSDRDFYARFAPGALRAWGLRSDAEIAAVDHRLKWNGVVVPQMMFYDPAVDAVRCTLPPNHINFRQMRMDLNLGANALGVDELDTWLTWDGYYTPSFVDNMLDIPGMESARMQGYKAFMVSTYRTSAGQWNSPRFRFIGVDGKVGWSFNRSDYFAAIGGELNAEGTDYLVPPFRSPAGLARNGREREAIFVDPVTGTRRAYGSDCLVPMESEFGIDVGVWTRWFARYRMRREHNYVDYSLFMADERRDPVCVYRQLGIQMLDPMGLPRPLLRQFWYEYNSSASRQGGEMTWYHPWLLAVDNPNLSTFLVRPFTS
jgi:hypothetical protein